MRVRPQRFLVNPHVQPQCAVRVNRERTFGLRHVFWPRGFIDLGSGLPLNNARTNKVVAKVGSGGLAFDEPAFPAVVSIPTTLPSTSLGWTQEFIGTVLQLPGTSYTLFGFNGAADGSSGTRDQLIECAVVSSSVYFRTYVYDGSAKLLQHSTAQVVGKTYHVIARCTSSLLSISVDGIAATPLAVSNVGFTGYSPPHLILTGSSGIRAHMACMWFRALSDVEIAKRFERPYSILTPSS